MECAASAFARTHFGGADLGDERLNRRLLRVAEQLAAHPGESFPKRFHDPADLQGFYRLMTHERVTHAAVLAPHIAGTLDRMRAAADVVLCLHDTTVLDYSGLDAIAELGQVGDGRGRGLYCHNCLAVAAGTGAVLGLAGQVLHRRRKVPKGESRAARRTHPRRESRLWKALSERIPPAPPGARWVNIADRGADLAEFLDHMAGAGKEYVVRSQHNRCLVRETDGKTEQFRLHDLARTLPAMGRRPLAVPAKDGRPEREAEVCVSWQAVTLRPSPQRRGEERGVPLRVWVIRAWEADPPAGAPGLEWILLTNIEVATTADAFVRVDWYAVRWVIEEYHKAQKTGCGIEAMQFRHLDRLEPAIGLLSVTAVLLLTLRDRSRAPDATDRPAVTCVPALWVRILSAWRHNRVRMDWSVHDFFFALARLGGHQNRKHDHPPGWLVLWRGWTYLQAMLDGASATGAT